MTSTAIHSQILDADWTARTILPIAFQGREIELEARAYQGTEPARQALALIHRGSSADASELPLVRVHSGCVTGDIFHSLRCDCHAQLTASLKHITAARTGVLIYLPYHEGRGIGLVNKVKAYALQDQGLDTVDANISLGEPIDARDYDLAARILLDLNCATIRLLTNNPAKLAALQKDGVTIAERVPLIIEATPYNEKYLLTKRERMAHKI